MLGGYFILPHPVQQLKDRTHNNENQQYIKRSPNEEQYSAKHAKIYDRARLI